MEENKGNMLIICENNLISYYDDRGMDWLDNLSNFSAGVGDTLTMGATSWLRKRLHIDDTVDYSSKSYIGGVVTEIVVEVSITAGGAALRKRAARFAGKSGRTALSVATRTLQKRLGVGPGMGQVHHINPLRAGRFPLPFEFANGTWNLKFYKGVSRGFNISHHRAHLYLKRLDMIDIIRTYTMVERFSVQTDNIFYFIKRKMHAAFDGPIYYEIDNLDNRFHDCVCEFESEIMVNVDVFLNS